MKTHYIFFAIAALAISACARDTQPSEPEGMQVTIKACLEGSNMTRTTLQDGGTQVYWEPSDEIKVFFRGTGNRFISQNTVLTKTADFTGTFSAVVGSNEGDASSHLIWGLYPYRADATSDGSSVTTTLPAEQTGRAGSFAKSTNITLAQSSGLNLAFYNVCGGVRFSLTQEGIMRVTFEGNNEETIAGKIKVAFADGIPVVQEVTEGEKMITLTAPDGGTFQIGQWYYISAIPGSLPSGYKMTFYKESESAKLTSSSSVTFKRGIFGSLADADEDLVFKPTGGDEPNPDDVIQFKDPIAKYACVEKFDTNKDGEVSYAEAAAVTSLDGLFIDWNTVTEFDEIQYFTSVTSTQGVFIRLRNLKHITIPDNITTLGTFQGCFALDTVKLPAALSSLPTYCFDGCSALKSVTLPTGITSIPDYAFRDCAALETLSVPSTLTSIGQYAFSGCAVLTGIDLPSGLKTIGNYAFQKCTALASVDFPASLTSIGNYAYFGCTALTSVTIGSGISLASYAFSGCTALETISVQGSSSVGSNAFSNCTGLTSAVLSAGVTLGQSVFSGCSSLASVVLPEDLTTIPAYCFQNCIKLSTITWPTAITTIGDYAFAGCRFADSDFTLQLPPSVTTIRGNAFGNLHHLILPSASPISISANSFIVDYTFLYVPANMVDMYKVRTNWSIYAERIRSIADYPVVAEPSIGGTVGEAIDLGLSVKWASWNVGASAPEEYGAYFAWGETEPAFWGYNWESYKWCYGSYNSLIKYNTNSSYGIVDNKTTLDLEDDAAHVKWGGTWRMPTGDEIQELLNNCTAIWTIENEVYGRRFTSKKEGYTDKSIFLPAAGYKNGTSSYGAGNYGNYRSSSLYSTPSQAKYLDFSTGSYLYLRSESRHYGFSIRPVCE